MQRILKGITQHGRRAVLVDGEEGVVQIGKVRLHYTGDPGRVC